MSARELYPSAHALAAMRARGVLWGDVVAAVSRAHVVSPHEGRTRYHRGDLTVVVAADGCVVTVLFNRAGQWTSEQMRERKSG